MSQISLKEFLSLSIRSISPRFLFGLTQLLLLGVPLENYVYRTQLE